MRASELTCRAFGIKPEGNPATESAYCMWCGDHIEIGEKIAKFTPQPSFMDGPSLARHGKPGYLCGWCVPLATKTGLGRTQQALVTLDGAYSIGKSVCKRWVLEHTPEPPFVMVSSDTKSQHMIWRTPVTRSKDLIYFRLGGRLFRLRMQRVRAAVKSIQALTKKINATVKKPVLSLFASLDTGIADPEFGKFKESALAHMDREMEEEFFALNPGEIWAVSMLSRTNLEAVAPELISLTKTTTTDTDQ